MKNELNQIALVTFDWRLGKLINLSKASNLAAGLVKYINKVRLASAPGKVPLKSGLKFKSGFDEIFKGILALERYTLFKSVYD